MGIQEDEYSIVERFSVLKAMFMEAEVVDVIAILDAVIVVEDICVAGKTDEIVSFSNFNRKYRRWHWTVDQNMNNQGEVTIRGWQTAKIIPPGTRKSFNSRTRGFFGRNI